MKKAEINHSNRRIASFMDYPYKDGKYQVEHYAGGIFVRISILQFHSSWNWLMPVIARINDVCYIRLGFCNPNSIKAIDAIFGSMIQKRYYYESNSIEAVYMAVIDCIDYLNKNN